MIYSKNDRLYTYIMHVNVFNNFVTTFPSGDMYAVHFYKRCILRLLSEVPLCSPWSQRYLFSFVLHVFVFVLIVYSGDLLMKNPSQTSLGFCLVLLLKWHHRKHNHPTKTLLVCLCLSFKKRWADKTSCSRWAKLFLVICQNSEYFLCQKWDVS